MIAEKPVADGVVSCFCWSWMLSKRLICSRAGAGPSISHYSGRSFLYNQGVNEK